MSETQGSSTHGDPPEDLAELAAAACLAPSLRNSQPWRLRVGHRVIDLWAARQRRIPYADPEGRGLTISCGAALAAVAIQARARGLHTHTQLLPNPRASDHLGRITIGERVTPSPEETWLAQALPKRRTHRGFFLERPLAPSLVQRLCTLAEAAGARLEPVDGATRSAVLAAMIAADHEQRRDPVFLKELAAWVDPTLTAQGLGIPGHTDEQAAILAGETTCLRRFADFFSSSSSSPSSSRPTTPSPALSPEKLPNFYHSSPILTETARPRLAIDDAAIDALFAESEDDDEAGPFAATAAPTPAAAPTPFSRRVAADDTALDRGSPVLAVLTTAADGPEAWMRAGEALLRLLLRGRVDHLGASFFGPVIEVASARAAVRAALGGSRWPQVVLRLGYAGDCPATPRLPPERVIERVR